MEETKDQWLWVVDEELVQALVANDAVDARSQKREIKSSALAKSLVLNAEGKTDAALQELTAALEAGEDLPEIYWTKGHLEFQLRKYDEAVQSYSKVLERFPSHKAGWFNLAVCLQKLE